MTNKAIPALPVALAILAMPRILMASGLNTHDFRDECGFSFVSPHEFTGSSEKCWKVKMTEDDFIIGDHIFSTKELFPNLQGKPDAYFFGAGAGDKSPGAGHFSRDAKGKIYNLRESYTQNFYGGVSFTILKRKEVISLRKRDHDRIIAFLVKIGREDPICIDHDDEKCWKKAEKSKWVEKNYECWDGLFFGKDGVSGVVASGLCSPSKPGVPFASLGSWQARLIKSLVVTTGEEPRADIQYKLIATGKQPYIEACRNDACRNINLPVQKQAVSYRLQDLAGRNEKIIIAEPVRGGMDVNFCAKAYLLATDDSMKELKAGQNESLCNVTLHEDRIVSRYRDAAKWHDVVYRILFPAKGLVKELADECVGCGMVTRTEYHPDGRVRNYWMLKDGKNYWERKIVTAKVVNARAWLYNTPNSKDKTKMYLVEGDMVILKKEQLSEDGSTWFNLVEYQTTNNRKISKWIAADALAHDAR